MLLTVLHATHYKAVFSSVVKLEFGLTAHILKRLLFLQCHITVTQPKKDNSKYRNTTCVNSSK